MIHIGIIGCGRTGMAYAAALAALPQVRVASVCDRSSRPLDAARRRLAVDSAYLRADPLLADPQVDAVVVAVPAGREALIRAAVRAGKPVLVAGLEGLDPEELPGLAAGLERTGGRVAFAVPAVAGEGFRLLQAQLGPGAPDVRYVRVVRSEPGGPAPLTLLMEEALALRRLTGVLPERALALSAAGDASPRQAVFAALRYASGLVATLDITCIEPEPARRVTVVQEERTLVLEEGGRSGGPPTVCHLQRGGPAVRTFPRPDREAAGDPLGRACRRFVAFLAGEEPRPEVAAADVAAAAAVAGAVRASARRHGVPVLVEGSRAAEGPPALRLIKGGGRGAAVPSRPARLRLISR